jgi:sugar lactone lactonase YvrE
MKRYATALAGLVLTACASVAASAPPSAITIVGSAIFPESIGADAAGNVYASSLDGTIYRAAAGSAKAVAWIRPDDTNKLLWSLGVLPDDRSNTLWVCTASAGFLNPPRTGDSAAVAFDLKTGAFKARYVLPKPAGEKAPAATCNDLTVESTGKVYLTDISGGRLFSIAPGAKEVTLEAADPLLVGVEAPAFAADGTLYLNNTRQNTLLRVDRTAAGAFKGLTRLTTSIPLNGPDGMRAYKGNQFLQAETGGSGRADLVTIEGDHATIAVIAEGTGSAGIMHIGDTAYTAEGKIGYLFDPKLKGQDPGPFTIVPHPIGGGQ